ncbi:MAG: hypothetical protein A2252_07265 [Elusimicrobia bacterium RIFOXYA2_FULL_39_19]|nr:MAG: hypothetical protein A2252_07265 [Elusimicrobia bacterium RIFOXYA2_FULL_39_19]
MHYQQNSFTELFKELYRRIFQRNPIIVLIAGLCPVLAISTTVSNAFSMSIIVLCVLLLSDVTIRLVRQFFKIELMYFLHVLILSFYVTIVDLFLKGFYIEISNNLGIFIPLIAVNCLFFEQYENSRKQPSFLLSLFSAIGSGIGFALIMIFVSFLRELLGSGKVFEVTVFSKPPAIFSLAPGGFIVIGFITAFIAYIGKRFNRDDK